MEEAPESKVARRAASLRFTLGAGVTPAARRAGDYRTRSAARCQVDDASWARSRGWALSTGVIALTYYLDTNPVIVAIARRQIDEVLAERRRTC